MELPACISSGKTFWELMRTDSSKSSKLTHNVVELYMVGAGLEHWAANFFINVIKILRHFFSVLWTPPPYSSASQCSSVSLAHRVPVKLAYLRWVTLREHTQSLIVPRNIPGMYTWARWSSIRIELPTRRPRSLISHGTSSDKIRRLVPKRCKRTGNKLPVEFSIRIYCGYFRTYLMSSTSTYKACGPDVVTRTSVAICNEIKDSWKSGCYWMRRLILSIKSLQLSLMKTGVKMNPQYFMHCWASVVVGSRMSVLAAWLTINPEMCSNRSFIIENRSKHVCWS